MREIQARFFSKIGGLIGGGVPWLDAFAVGARSVGDDPALQDALERVVDRLRQGHSPSDAIAEEPLFSEEVVRTVRAGEEMGDLESKAMHIAEQLLAGAFEVGRSVAVSAEAAARLEEIVDAARASGATHVHLEPTEIGGCVRVRRAGRLSDEIALSETDYASLLAAVDVACPVPASLADFREGPGAVLRLEPELTPEDIEIPEDAAKRLRDWAATGRGLVLVAGRPAAARIALVRALLEGLPEGAKVCAVSRVGPIPVPALHVEGDDTVAALAAAVGQDPDAIVLPEIEDRETARAAVREARRGSLVVVGAPAPDAEAATRGLTTIGVDEALVVDALAGACAIRLLRPEPGAGPRGPLALVETLGPNGRPLEGTRTIRDEAAARAEAGEISRAEALSDGIV
jgi:hypothetical protein